MSPASCDPKGRVPEYMKPVVSTVTYIRIELYHGQGKLAAAEASVRRRREGIHGFPGWGCAAAYCTLHVHNHAPAHKRACVYKRSNIRMPTEAERNIIEGHRRDWYE